LHAVRNSETLFTALSNIYNLATSTLDPVLGQETATTVFASLCALATANSTWIYTYIAASYSLL